MQICTGNPVRTVLSLIAVFAALALAACGSSDSGSDLGPDPADVAPADTSLYFEAVVRPEGDMKDSLLSALSKITNDDDPGALIRSAVDSSFSENGVSYSDDIEPWLGQRLGAFLTGVSGGSGEGAIAVAVTDQGAAQSAIDKSNEADGTEVKPGSYNGVDYQIEDGGDAYAFIDDFLVAGTEEGVKASIDASKGDSLSGNGDATDALDSAPSDSIFRTYIDAVKLADLAVQSGALTQKDLDTATGGQLDQLDGAIVISGAATSDSMSLEASGPGGSDGPGEIVSTLPGDSWFALGVPMVGEAISAGYQSFVQGFEAGLQSLDQSGLSGVPEGQLPDIEAQLQQALGLDIAKDFGWAGDLGAFVGGSSVFDLGGGIVIDTDDEQAASAALGKLASALQRQPSLKVSKTSDGFQIQTAGAPVGAQAAVKDGKVVIAIAGATVDEVLSPPETLADSDNFKSASSALGDGFSTSLYLDFPTITSLVASTGQGGDPGYQQVKPVLDALTYLVAGSGTEDDRAVGRLVLGLTDAGGSDSAEAAAITP